MSEIVDESDQFGKKWMVFPRVSIVVYLPTSLKWDDGVLIDAAAAPNVVRRISEAIARAGESARTEISDEVYEKARQDFETFGPKREKGTSFP